MAHVILSEMRCEKRRGRAVLQSLRCAGVADRAAARNGMAAEAPERLQRLVRILGLDYRVRRTLGRNRVRPQAHRGRSRLGDQLPVLLDTAGHNRRPHRPRGHPRDGQLGLSEKPPSRETSSGTECKSDLLHLHARGTPGELANNNIK